MTSTAPIRSPFFLEGNFAPVEDEITTTDLEVTGELPRELCGVYLRNGPNPKRGTSAHWFVGDGMVHGVRLEGGRAPWYRNRYVRTARPEGRPDVRGGGASNTHVMAHGGRILSFVETSLPMELDGDLGTIGPCDFGGTVATAFTAHGKVCPLTGELLAFGYQFASPHLTLYRIDREGRLTERRIIPVPAPSYLHDFAITERYALFFDTPARMVADWGGGVLPFQWQEGQPTRIGVVPRAGGETRWFPVAACYLSHAVNAFEIDGRIVIDGVGSDRFPGFPRLHRWEIDLATGVATGASLDRRVFDFPRIDERRTGRPYRHTYGVELPDFMGPEPLRGTVLRRYDLESGASVATAFGERYEVGEGVFVPASATAAEEHGWLLAFRYDRQRNTSDLVVLDARDLGGTPVAVVAMPRRVPMGFHGSWVPDRAG